MRLLIKNFICFFSIVVIITCNESVPDFDQNSAYQFLLDQCDFGPRNPGSVGYNNCRDFLLKTLGGYSDTVFTQPFVIDDIDDKQYDLSNIIAQYNINSNSHLLIGAHWDTRPIADQDNERKDEPIDGANDGNRALTKAIHWPQDTFEPHRSLLFLQPHHSRFPTRLSS